MASQKGQFVGFVFSTACLGQLKQTHQKCDNVPEWVLLNSQSFVDLPRT